MEIQRIKISEEERVLISSFIKKEYPNEVDFNLLMPVVEKIEIDCKFDVHIYGHYNWEKPNRCVILDWRNKEIVGMFNDSKIQCVFDAVVEFIKWYNQNK